MPFRDLNRRYRHIQRYRQIAEVLIRNGFGYVLDRLDLYHLIPLKNRVQKWRSENELGGQGRRLRWTLEQLGATFIKFGQVLSIRSDLIGNDLRCELEKLQDDVEPVDFPSIRRVIEQEMGTEIGELFLELEEKPIAAASIGQVHRARLHSGEEVVVKIQRPGIARKIKVDLEIMQNLAHLFKDRFPHPSVDPVGLVEEFARGILTELDYRNEGRNAERFRQIFKNDPQVLVPKIYWDCTSQKILTMELVEGRKITDVTAEEDKSRLAEVGASAFLTQVLEKGFFHADPHPGNILVTKDGKMAFLDFGLMGELDETSRDEFARLFLSLLRKDTQGVVDAFLKLGMVKTNLDSRLFQREIGGMIEKYYGIEIKDIEIGTLFDEIMEIGRKHNIHFPSDLVLLGKAVVTFEGVIRLLDPELNILFAAKPFAGRLVRQRLHPRRILKDVMRSTGGFMEKAKLLPEDLHRVLEKILQDDLEIVFKHENLENIASKLDIVVNRLVVGIIVSALFVGSSLTIQAQIGPQFRGVSMIGFVGYLLAGILGLWLVFAILRSGRF